MLPFERVGDGAEPEPFRPIFYHDIVPQQEQQSRVLPIVSDSSSGKQKEESRAAPIAGRSNLGSVGDPLATSGSLS